MAKKKSRTREARQRRQQQRRRSQRGLALLAIVIVAVVAAAMLIVSNQPVDVFIPPDLEDRYEGITRSFSAKGYPQLGDQDAPVTVDEFASFACPGCEALHSESFDAILERVRTGQILFTYVPLQTGSIPNASGAARAALCAGRQGMFWEMHDVLFDWQTRYANTAYSQARLLAGVSALGLNESGFTNCFNSAAISEVLSSAMTEDVTGTPTINVNGVSLASQRTGGIPSTAEVLQAIDLATPDDWGQSAADAVETETEDEGLEASGDDMDEVSEDPIVDVESDAEVDSEAPETTAETETPADDEAAGEDQSAATETVVSQPEESTQAADDDDATATESSSG